MKAGFTLNGEPYQAEIRPHQRLLDMLRDDLCLTGAKEGCRIGECDTCTVILDDRVVTSCLVPASSMDSRNMVIIKGMDCDGKLNPIQEAVPKNHALRYGLCTLGFITSAKALLDENPDTTKEETHYAIFGNLCRCAGYEQLIDTICQVTGELKKLRMEKL